MIKFKKDDILIVTEELPDGIGGVYYNKGDKILIDNSEPDEDGIYSVYLIESIEGTLDYPLELYPEWFDKVINIKEIRDSKINLLLDEKS